MEVLLREDGDGDGESKESKESKEGKESKESKESKERAVSSPDMAGDAGLRAPNAVDLQSSSLISSSHSVGGSDTTSDGGSSTNSYGNSGGGSNSLTNKKKSEELRSSNRDQNIAEGTVQKLAGLPEAPGGGKEGVQSHYHDSDSKSLRRWLWNWY